MGFSSYSDLKTSILSWLGRPADPLVPTDDLIRLFESDANRRLRTHHQEVSTEITTVADTDTYDLPDDFLEVREVKITSLNPRVVLDYFTPAQLDDRWAYVQNSRPFDYTIEGSQIRFGPTPNAEYTIRVEYWQSLTGLNDNAYSVSDYEIVDAGSDYSEGDVLVISGGTPVEVALLRVETVSVLDAYHADILAVVAGGTDYSADDVLHIAGGTETTPTTLIVDTVDVDGVILTAHIGNPGVYSATPANSVTVTGGTGNDDATFDITWVQDIVAGSILYASIQEAGDYTVRPSDPVSISGGTGNDDATFDLTWANVAGTTNWLLQFYPDLYLYGSLGEAEVFLGGEATERLALFIQRREAIYAALMLADRKYRTGGAPLTMRTSGGTP